MVLFFLGTYTKIQFRPIEAQDNGGIFEWTSSASHNITNIFCKRKAAAARQGLFLCQILTEKSRGKIESGRNLRLFYRWKILVKMTLCCCCFSIINTTTKHDQDDVLHQNFHQDKNLWNILNCEQPKFFEISEYSDPDKNVRNIFRTCGPNMNIEKKNYELGTLSQPLIKYFSVLQKRIPILN